MAKKPKGLLRYVELHAVSSRRARYTDVRVNWQFAKFKIDSGAEVTVVSPSFPVNEVEGEVSGPGSLRSHVLGTSRQRTQQVRRGKRSITLTKLNQAIERERFVLPTVEQILGQLGGAQVFSKLDARSGFH